MTALELLRAMSAEPALYQLFVNEFVDAFRRSTDAERAAMVAEGPSESGRFEGLVSAIVSALCREAAIAAPAWIEAVGSPEPFFIPDTHSFALRVRLMLEAPPAFRIRKVFVPTTYLERA